MAARGPGRRVDVSVEQQTILFMLSYAGRALHYRRLTGRRLRRSTLRFTEEIFRRVRITTQFQMTCLAGRRVEIQWSPNSGARAMRAFLRCVCVRGCHRLERVCVSALDTHTLGMQRATKKNDLTRLLGHPRDAFD